MKASSSFLAFGVLLAEGTPTMAQETTRVSVDSTGAQGNDGSAVCRISADGNVLAFQSYASNLVAKDTNGQLDVFVHDRTTGITELVSVDSSGAQGNGQSYAPSISSDGLIVAFVSNASNLVVSDTNAKLDVFVHDRTSGVTERVSVNSSGGEAQGGSYGSASPSISADGRFIAFWSSASNLVTSDTNGCDDVFVRDRTNGITERVNVDSSGAEANRDCSDPAISADGQVVAFYGLASNLVAGDTNGFGDIFVHDLTSGVTVRVSLDSLGAEGNAYSFSPALTADGQIVVFNSSASNLVSGDTNGQLDVFVHDRSTGITEIMSVDSSGGEGNAGSERASISADGKVVAFNSGASNLVAGDTNGADDVFIRDRSMGITQRISITSSGAQGDSYSEGHGQLISADGQVVAFSSAATNLVAGDTNSTTDVFVHDRCSAVAMWSNYGSGFPGTNGIPSLAAESNPVLGSTVTLDLANSYGTFTAALLFVGFQQTTIHSSLGGDLLVVPFLSALVALLPSGTSFTGDIPDDQQLCGFEIDVQAIEADPGATKGVSFTPGLELILGH